ncbi:MAG: hypothetical protein U0401_23655 [Anaerolineae bacterium]
MASSAYETAVNRTTEALLPGLDLMAVQVNNLDLDLVEDAYRNDVLYDEHTWGAFSSVRQPYLPYTQGPVERQGRLRLQRLPSPSNCWPKQAHFARRLTGVAPEGDSWQPFGAAVNPPITPAETDFWSSTLWAGAGKWSSRCRRMVEAGHPTISSKVIWPATTCDQHPQQSGEDVHAFKDTSEPLLLKDSAAF